MKIKMKNFVFFAFAIFALAMVAANASAETIFSEDFNDGNFGGWTQTGWTNTGNRAESNGTDASLLRVISTSGHDNIVVSYERQLEGDWEADDNFRVSWSTDGATFNELEEVVGNASDSSPNETSIVTKTFNLPASAEDNSGFRLRFECTTDDSGERCIVDNVLVTGDVKDNFVNFCSSGPQGGNLEISDVKIDNRGRGEDDEWMLLDEIEIEVEVSNEGNSNIDDIVVEIGLFDSNGKNVADDLDFLDSDEEEIDLGRIRDGDEETATFRFRVPADFDDGDYKLAVKAYSDDLGQSNECVDFSNDLSDGEFERISIEREDDEGRFIYFDNFVFSPNEATCNERVTMSFDVFNVGEEDQDRVRVRVFNTELGVDETYEITSDLDQGDDEQATVEFNIPANVQDKLYSLRVAADYDYRNGNYRESSDGDTVVAFRVIGCGVGPGPGPGQSGDVAVISASLQSDAVAGEKLIVRARITSTLNSDAEFRVDVSGFESWAELESISDDRFTLSPGQDQEVIIEFNVDEDAEGTQDFEIEVSAQGQSESREVSVNLEGSGTGNGGGFSFGGNSYLWIIGIVNVILIILIIIVAVRISRRE